MLAQNEDLSAAEPTASVRVRVGPGEWYEIDKVAWQVQRRRRNGEILFKNQFGDDYMKLTDGRVIALSRQNNFRLIPHPNSGFPDSRRLEADVALDLISEFARNSAFFKRDVVIAWKNRSPQDTMKSLIAGVLAAREARGAWIPTRGTSERSAFDWVSLWRKAGSPEGVDARLFIPQYHNSGNKCPRYDPFVDEVIKSAIEAMLASGAKMTVEQLHGKVAADVLDECKRLLANRNEVPGNLKSPSKKYIRKLFYDATPEELYRRKHGKRLAKDEFEPVGLCPDAYWPLQVVEIDHTQADVHLVDEHGKSLGRPWVTVVLDRYSRMVLAIHIGWEPPSWLLLATTLRRAILYKDWLQRLYPSVKSDWPCFGPPTSVVVDNGLEFHGDGFVAACEHIPIDVEYAPIKMPKYKAKIERFFRTLKQSFFQTLPGGTSSDPRRNEAFGAEHGARLTLEELRERTFKWVLDVYHYRQHDGLGSRRPVDLWMEGLRSRGGLPLPPPEEKLLPLFGEVVSRSLSDKGVEFEGLFYNDGEDGHIRRLRNQRAAVPKHRIRVDPHDIRNLWVEDPEQRQWVKIPCLNEETITVTHPSGARVGVSLHQWRQAAELAKSRATAEAQLRFPELVRALRDLFDDTIAVANRPRARRGAQRIRKSADRPYEVPASVMAVSPAPPSESDAPLETPSPPPDTDMLDALSKQYEAAFKLPSTT